MLAAAAGWVLALGADQAMAQKEKAAPVIRDAVYRGTMVCGKLPFIQTGAGIDRGDDRGNAAKYTRPVALADRHRRSTARRQRHGRERQDQPERHVEEGRRQLRGELYRRFRAPVAKLTGAQVWSHDGKTYKRECSGAIKRPLAAFLPKDGKKN